MLPCLVLCAPGFQHPFAVRDYEAGCFGEWYELNQRSCDR
jgi:hypothetical protein